MLTWTCETTGEAIFSLPPLDFTDEDYETAAEDRKVWFVQVYTEHRKKAHNAKGK